MVVISADAGFTSKPNYTAEVSERLTRDITVRQAVNILHYCFNAGHAEIRFCGEDTSPLEMLAEKSYLENIPAAHIYIRFFGGPPGQYNWFNGTLFTFLSDRIMDAVAHKRNNKLSHY